VNRTSDGILLWSIKEAIFPELSASGAFSIAPMIAFKDSFKQFSSGKVQPVEKLIIGGP